MCRFALIVLAAGPLLAGCGDDPGESPEAERPKGMIEQAVDAQQQSLEKAKALEQQMKDAAEKQKEEIDEQGS